MQLRILTKTCKLFIPITKTSAENASHLLSRKERTLKSKVTKSSLKLSSGLVRIAVTRWSLKLNLGLCLSRFLKKTGLKNCRSNTKGCYYQLIHRIPRILMGDAHFNKLLRAKIASKVPTLIIPIGGTSLQASIY